MRIDTLRTDNGSLSASISSLTERLAGLQGHWESQVIEDKSQEPG